MGLRRLSEADRAAVDAFLVRHRDSSMFLRANVRRAGFTFTGQRFEATYVGAFEQAQLVGVTSHTWNGMLIVQAPGHAAELALAAVEASGRDVSGFAGPSEQVARARAALGLDSVKGAHDDVEDLYGLPLSELRVPVEQADVSCRRPLPSERELLLRWRVAYELEQLGAQDDEHTLQRSQAFLDAQLEGGHAWVAVARSTGQLLSLSAFNAALPDIVQLGGIYTPPEHRGRRYARLAISAQLSAARADGATRCVLFTNNPRAVRCYEALGFERTGSYDLVLLR